VWARFEPAISQVELLARRAVATRDSSRRNMVKTEAVQSTPVCLSATRSTARAQCVRQPPASGRAFERRLDDLEFAHGFDAELAHLSGLDQLVKRRIAKAV